VALRGKGLLYQGLTMRSEHPFFSLSRVQAGHIVKREEQQIAPRLLNNSPEREAFN
jgi:hypothetical protein